MSGLLSMYLLYPTIEKKMVELKMNKNGFRLLTCDSQTSTVLGNPFNDPESMDRKICREIETHEIYLLP